jgi:hypothetical protein
MKQRVRLYELHDVVVEAAHPDGPGIHAVRYHVLKRHVHVAALPGKPRVQRLDGGEVGAETLFAVPPALDDELRLVRAFVYR